MNNIKQQYLWLVIPHLALVFLTRLDEAAVALQKEKNMYKEIENFPMCFKVGYSVILSFSSLCILTKQYFTTVS